MTSDALESTLNDLAHLLIPPSRLSLRSDVELGVGGYGEVCLATLDALSASPTTVAVKQLRIILDQGVRLRVAIRLARELKVWAKVKHRNILELLGYYLSENYGSAQLISPFMANGNVIQYIKNRQPDIPIRLKFVRDISLGMDYLHNCDPPICHGDLKPANVLISGELDAVLCDFGLASFIQESGVSSGLTTSHTTKGSMRYMSPELLLDEAMHSLKSDVWAWGCTTFEMLTDCIPYSALQKESAVILAISKSISPGAIDNFLSLGSDPNHNPSSSHYLALESLQSKVPECWNFEPTERPSSSSILRVFANWEESNSSTAFPTCPVGEVSGSGYNDDGPPSARMCKVCSVRQVFQNFEFCSKTCKRFAAQGHARRASDARPGYGQGPARRGPLAPDDDDDDDGDDPGHAGSTSQVPYRSNSLCINCRQNHKVKGRDFCSKACLNALANGGGQAPPFPGGNRGGFAPVPYLNTGYGGQAYSQCPPAPPGKPCKIPACNGTEYQPGSTYCSHTCLKAAVKQGLEIACLMCKELPKASHRHFCGKSCAEKADKNAPILLDVPKNDPKFADVVKQFNSTWQGDKKPTVHRVCKVINAKAVEDRYQAYRQKVEQAGGWVAQGKTAGNENRRWHGTVRECTVGDDPNKLDMCTSTSCRLCCAIRTTFDIKYVAVGVFGLGIYTSAYSSTSHGYTRVATKGSPYRAMFMTRVVTGKEHIFVWGTTDPNAKAPPAGYDSVAVCAKHSALIVFQNEAICPSWLVLYS